MIERPPPSIVCRPHSLNIFSSETTGPFEAKFHMESPWDEGTKVCSTVLVTWPRWPLCPYMVKTLKKSSSLEPKGWWLWNLLCSIGCSCSTKVVQMMTLDWPWPILRQGQIWSLMLLYPIDCSETCGLWFETSNRWPKRREVSIDNKTLSPGGCMARGYIHVLNHEKNI